MTPVDPFRPGVITVDGPVDEAPDDRRVRTARAAVEHTEAQLVKARAAVAAALANLDTQRAIAESKITENQREVERLEAELTIYADELAAIEGTTDVVD